MKIFPASGYQKWLKDPLIHFLLLGSLLFITHELLNQEGPGLQEEDIHVSAKEVHWIKTVWSQQWRRQPTDEELNGLVLDYVKELVLAREAKELDLGENDTIIRRRLAQKMEFFLQDTTRLLKPHQSELREYFATRYQQYQRPARFSFSQIYFKDMDSARKAVQTFSESSNEIAGDASLLPSEYVQIEEVPLRNLLGAEFVGSLNHLKPGEWVGPVKSVYGFHLVRLYERVPATQPAFEEVQARVLEDWRESQRTQIKEQYFASLVDKYNVTVDASVTAEFNSVRELIQ